MFRRRKAVSQLQAHYYRMNECIPLWDDDGWLIFDGEDDVEPKCTSIKCQEKDAQGRLVKIQPPGLAQRYPERAIRYSWVNPETKRNCQDWGEPDSQ